MTRNPLIESCLRGPLGRVHFTGIGGIGTSGVALLIMDLGGAVGGTDLRRSEITEIVASRGADIRIGARPEMVRYASLVVVPAALPPAHPEIIEARGLGIPVATRDTALLAICAARARHTVICVGAASRALLALRLACSIDGAGWCVGAIATGTDGIPIPHARFDSRMMVVEVDERDLDFAAIPQGADILISDVPDGDGFGYYAGCRFGNIGEFIDAAVSCANARSVVYPEPKNGSVVVVRTGGNSVIVNSGDRARGSVMADTVGAVASAYMRHVLGLDAGIASCNAAGWFAPVPGHPGDMYEIRMHPLIINQDLRHMSCCGEESRPIAVMRPFVSTLRRYSVRQWASCFAPASRVIIISPPYEGCGPSECEDFARSLSSLGVNACVSGVDDVRAAVCGPALWIGAPDMACV